MKYLSVCSGIEAASVAWHHLGWTPAGFSEIEPFPSAVLAHRFSNVTNYGDMTNHAAWPIEPGSIDILVGGTPCQSFSIAGLRAGLSDPRGGLMLTYLEIARRLRPKWVVWENVPGVLSSGGGRDFGSFLGALGQLGYGWAYRVLDAQWCRTHGHPRAVPQRRRRVFVVGCLGDWERAAQVLFERESVQRDSSTRRTQGQGAAADAEAGVGCGGWMPNNPGVVSSVCTKWSKGTGGPSGSEHFNLLAQPVPFTKSKRAQSTTDDETWVDGQVNPTLSLFDQGDTRATTVAIAFKPGQSAEARTIGAQFGVACTLEAGGGGNNKQAVAFAQNQVGEVRVGDVTGTINTNSNASGRNTPMAAVGIGIDCYNGAVTGDVAATMGTPGSSVNASGPTVMQAVACVNMQGSKANACVSTDGTSFTLNAMHGHDVHSVAFTEAGQGQRIRPTDQSSETLRATKRGPYSDYYQAMTAPTLTAHNDPSRSPQSSEVTQQVAAVPAASMAVRRLTPRECERLQGFPDDWTMIPWRKKPADECPDGPRYKALGNSMAVNCMAWIGQRIAEVSK